jgi:anti-anti-sigma regulatory factor
MTVTDLRALDELCRLAVAARRLGCRVHLTGTDPELRELLDLAGVGDVLGECPADDRPPDPTPPGGDLR